MVYDGEYWDGVREEMILRGNDPDELREFHSLSAHVDFMNENLNLCCEELYHKCECAQPIAFDAVDRLCLETTINIYSHPKCQECLLARTALCGSYLKWLTQWVETEETAPIPAPCPDFTPAYYE